MSTPSMSGPLRTVSEYKAPTQPVPRLRSGRADSALAIAEQDQVRSAYVTGVMGLAYLAPDIVHRLVRGDHPRELTVGRLMKMLPLPLDWDEQRVVLKMSG